MNLSRFVRECKLNCYGDPYNTIPLRSNYILQENVVRGHPSELAEEKGQHSWANL